MQTSLRCLASQICMTTEYWPVSISSWQSDEHLLLALTDRAIHRCDNGNRRRRIAPRLERGTEQERVKKEVMDP